MIATAERLKTLTVADAMSHNLICISSNSTMSEAADLLCEHQISGAPVVDEHGRCVGVISGWDFIHSKAEELESGDFRQVLEAGSPYGPLYIEEVRHDLVRRHMSPGVRTVEEHRPLVEAARIMCRDRVHRLIVVDADNRPSGILTSLGLVATLIAAID